MILQYILNLVQLRGSAALQPFFSQVLLKKIVFIKLKIVFLSIRLYYKLIAISLKISLQRAVI